MKNRLMVFATAVNLLKEIWSGLSKAPQAYTSKDTTMYLTFNAKGKSNSIQLVDANTKRIEGITNFDGNKLDPGRYIVIDGVRALAETAASTTVGTANWDSAPQVALKNSELVITQNEEIFRIPANEIFNLHRSNAVNNADDFREISHMPIIKPDAVYKIEWVFPNEGGVPGTVDTSLVRLEFRAHEFVITA